MARFVSAALGALAVLAAGSASAQTAWSWQLEAAAGVVSDYRYRGYSLSGESPALQAGVTLSHASGVYGDAYLSTIEEYGLGADGDGANLEVTLTAGWAGDVLGLDVDAAVSTYQYPDGSDVAYTEFPVQAGKTFGAMTWTLGAAYAPRQEALGDEDNRYVWVSLDYAPEAWPVSLAAHVGQEDGAYAPDGKTDWSLGVNAPVGPVTLGLTWVDSDVDSGAGVASLFVDF